MLVSNIFASLLIFILAIPVDDFYIVGALAFDAEYVRWMEEQNRQINELRATVNSHVGDTELRTVVDNVSTHFNDVFRLKCNAAKADVFHILSGMWKTPAERCFMWIGGFRPSELLKVCPFPYQMTYIFDWRPMCRDFVLTLKYLLLYDISKMII